MVGVRINQDETYVQIQVRDTGPGIAADFLPHIPAIALTAYARTQDWIRALTAGYNTHVAKPVEIKELVTVVKCLIGKIG
jgi:CheY-like chemotaxis protein